MLDQKLSETNVYLVPNEAALNLVEAFKFNLNLGFAQRKYGFHLVFFVEEVVLEVVIEMLTGLSFKKKRMLCFLYRCLISSNLLQIQEMIQSLLEAITVSQAIGLFRVSFLAVFSSTVSAFQEQMSF